MKSKPTAAQPTTEPMMMGDEMDMVSGVLSGEEAGTMGLGVRGTVVALAVALPDAGVEVLATLVGGALGGALGGAVGGAAVGGAAGGGAAGGGAAAGGAAAGVTVWHAGSVGEISHVGTD